MAKPEWGIKRNCQACGKKFYDLSKSPIICPYCGAELDPNYHLKTRKPKSVPLKSSLENDNDLTEDIENIDNIEIDPDAEVVSDDDPLLEINKDEQNVISDEDNDISFIHDDEITEDNSSIDVEINDDNKN